MATQAGYYHPTFFNSYLVGKIVADNNCYAILTTSTINPETDTVATIVGNEYSSTNGYARQLVDVSSLAGTYDATNNYTNFSSLTAEFEATGGDIIFRSAVLMIGGNGTRGNTTGSIIAVTQYGSNQTIVNGAATPFTVIWNLQFAHGTYNTAGTNPAF